MIGGCAILDKKIAQARQNFPLAHSERRIFMHGTVCSIICFEQNSERRIFMHGTVCSIICFEQKQY